MHCRRILLQVPAEVEALQNSDLSPDPVFAGRRNGPSEANTKTISRLQRPTTFDSSMAFTILVLLTALFFMGIFFRYIRLCIEEDSSDVRRRRHPSRPATAPGGLHSHQKSGGVDSSTIEALPLVSYGGRGGAKQLINDCSICLSEFEEGEIVKLIPHCGHVFHPQCLDTWLASHSSCPLCRGTQFFKVIDEDEVRLDVEEEEDSNGGNELGGRSTEDDCDTRRIEGMRRTASCTSLGKNLVLRRSLSL